MIILLVLAHFILPQQTPMELDGSKAPSISERGLPKQWVISVRMPATKLTSRSRSLLHCYGSTPESIQAVFQESDGKFEKWLVATSEVGKNGLVHIQIQQGLSDSSRLECRFSISRAIKATVEGKSRVWDSTTSEYLKWVPFETVDVIYERKAAAK